MLIAGGYGSERYIRRFYSWRDFRTALDVVARKAHDENRIRVALAGGDPDEWPGDYQGSEEEQDIEALYEDIESELEASPLVRHVRQG